MSDTLKVFFEFVDRSASQTQSAAKGVRDVTKAIEQQQAIVKQAERELRQMSIDDKRARVEETRLKLLKGGEEDLSKTKRQLAKQETQLRRDEATHRLSLLSDEQKSSKAGFVGLGPPVLMIAQGIGLALSAMKEFAVATAYAYWNVSKLALQQTEHARNVKASLNLMTKGHGGALYDALGRQANTLGFDQEDVVGAGSRLAATRRFSTDQIQQLLGGAADLTATLGDQRGDGMNKLVELIAKAAEDPLHGFSDDIVPAIQSATGNTVGREDVMAAYGSLFKQRYGRDAKPGELIGLQTGGAGIRNSDLPALIQEIARLRSAMNGGKSPGDFARQYAEGSVTAQVSRLTGRFFKLFEQDPSKSEHVAGFLSRLDKFLDPQSQTGGRLHGIVDNMTTRLVGYLDKISTPEGMKKFEEDFNRVIGVLERVAAAMERFVILAAKAAGWTADALSDKDAAELTTAQTDVRAGFDLVTGDTEDFWRTLRRERIKMRRDHPVFAQLTGHNLFWDKEEDEAEDAQDRVLQNIKKRRERNQTPLNPDPPLAAHAKGGLVTRPHMGLIGEAGPELIIPLSQVGQTLGKMGGGMNIHAPISINLQIDNATPDTADAIAAKLQTVLPSMLATTFERLGLQAGAI